MAKTKITSVFLSLLLIAQPRGEAQLNGEYTYDIADIFGTSPWAGGNIALSSPYLDLYSAYIYIDDTQPLILNHNPKNGSIQIQAVADFSYDHYAGFYSYTQPNNIYPEYEGDTWSLNNPSFVVTGKTYTDKRTKKSLLDISGTITLKGTYTPANMPETRISRGSLTFKASKLDNNADEIPYVTLKGSATLANKQTKLFKGTEFQLNNLLFYGGSSYYDNNSEYGVIWHSSFYLDLNVATTGSNISGTAKAYYYDDVQDLNPNDNIDWSVYTSQYPDPEVPAKELTYSVKGTRKNGIATLNLTGQGVIKGLKATIHIDESTEEIVQNGKNSITLYGQTITY